RALHKGDGNYSFEIFPVLEADFKQQFPGIEINMKADDYSIESFTWCYKDMNDQKVVLVCDLYQKKKKKVRIHKLADGKVVTDRFYKKMLAMWEDEQIIEQIPAIMMSRMTLLDVICNYKFIQNQIIEYSDTDYCDLPHVFFDGNSETLSRQHSNTQYQFTKPYYYHAKGAQDMMNFMGIAIAAHVDNLSMSQFIVKEEAIPQQQDYIDAITDPQRANTIVVRAYSENDPTKPIPEPIREVVKVPLPPEVTGTFNQSAQLVSAILGSTASNPENAADYISGKAVIEAMNVNNSTGMPYTIGYLAGLEQMARIHVNLAPKVYMGKRTIPVIKKDGDKVYQDINEEGKPSMNFEQGSMMVNVTAGVNFQVQKNQALQSIIGLTQSNPKLAEFFSSEFGLPILVDNLTIYGADRLKEAVAKWMEQQQQQQQQMMQMQQQQMQNDPRMIKAKADVQKVQLQGQELQQKAQTAQFEQQIEVAKLQIEKELADAKIMEAEGKAEQAQIDSGIRIEEHNTSKFNHSIDAAVKIAEMKSKEHEHKMNEHDSVRKSVELHHKIKTESEAKQGEKSND
ncbi:MAG TPA: portal protein, partial [Rhabdochlamydiaceae bacterium]